MIGVIVPEKISTKAYIYLLEEVGCLEHSTVYSILYKGDNLYCIVSKMRQNQRELYK